MNTAEEIIAYLDVELDETRKQYKRWRDNDTSEATKYLIKMNTLEQLLDEIDPQSKEPEPIAKVLVTMPEKPKPKRTFLSVYVNVFSLLVYFTSMFFIANLIYEINFLDGTLVSILAYMYCVLHTVSYWVWLLNAKILKKDE